MGGSIIIILYIWVSVGQVYRCQYCIYGSVWAKTKYVNTVYMGQCGQVYRCQYCTMYIYMGQCGPSLQMSIYLGQCGPSLEMSILNIFGSVWAKSILYIRVECGNFF